MKLISEEEAGARVATILVSSAKAKRGGAAFTNSEMMLVGGKWDTFRMLTHPGTSIIPAAFVAAEGEVASGRDFITGLAAGYEVMERMAADFIPTVMARASTPVPCSVFLALRSQPQKFLASPRARLLPPSGFP
jgi:2-methylcitrate dehydratase PrpD